MKPPSATAGDRQIDYLVPGESGCACLKASPAGRRIPLECPGAGSALEQLPLEAASGAVITLEPQVQVRLGFFLHQSMEGRGIIEGGWICSWGGKSPCRIMHFVTVS